MAGSPLLRIGELSKRTGVSVELLRAWERRYGLLHPSRSSGGLRLYASADVERVRLMQQHLAEGLAAAQAAAAASRAVLEEEAPPPALSWEALREELGDALDRFDEPRAQAVLDRLLAVTSLETLLGEVVLPYLRALGERCGRGDATVAQEHFATVVLRSRLLGLALRAHGWRIVYLGPDAPIDTIEDACGRVEPHLVVLSAVTHERVRPVDEELRALAARRRPALGGAAAMSGVLESERVLLLGGDPIAEAARVTGLAAKVTA